jgi:nuclear pore complex protein Nup98-Nup96
MEVRELLDKRERVGYHIERLKPRVGGLCARVASMEAKTAKEHLCQSEIAKKVAHLMRAVLSLEGTPPAAARELAQLTSQLPMPEDYALQELRTLTRNYMMEIIETESS